MTSDIERVMKFWEVTSDHGVINKTNLLYLKAIPSTLVPTKIIDNSTRAIVVRFLTQTRPLHNGL